MSQDRILSPRPLLDGAEDGGGVSPHPAALAKITPALSGCRGLYRPIYAKSLKALRFYGNQERTHALLFLCSDVSLRRGLSDRFASTTKPIFRDAPEASAA
jgi:hypothetical protein